MSCDFVCDDYEFIIMSLDCEFIITVGVYDLWINTTAIRKHVRFNRVREAGRRLYPPTRAADLGQIPVHIRRYLYHN